MKNRKGQAFNIIVFLFSLFIFAFVYIIFLTAEDTLFNVATTITTDADLSTNLTLFHNLFLFLPAIILFLGLIWIWTRSQKKGLGDFETV